MQKKRYLLCALACAIFFPSFDTLAQERIWGTLVKSSSHEGEVFYLNKDGSGFTRSFDAGQSGLAGTWPHELIRASDGTLLGINENNGAAVLYRISKDGVIRLRDFTSGNGGTAHLTEGSDGFIYGVANGAAGNSVYLFRIRNNGNNFDQRTYQRYGFSISGDLLKRSDGSVYGMSSGGGANSGAGFIFKVRPNLGGIDVVYDFSKPLGKKPVGKLIEGADGFLYGVTNTGGTLNYGAIFKVSPDGQQYTKLYDFDNKNGRYPKGSLVLDDLGVLYGTTNEGGNFKKGVVFKINPDGTGYTILHHFDGVNGQKPEGDLIHDNGQLYGYALGDQPDKTFLFRLQTNGSGFTRLYDFQQGLHAPGNLLFIQEHVTPNIFLTLPPDEDELANTNGRFRTREIKGALEYTLELSHTPGFETLAFTVTSPTRDLQIDGGLPFNTTYHARLKTNVLPGYGPATTFTTRGPVENTFVSRPANGATNVGIVDVFVIANEVQGATHYTMEFSKVPDFSDSLLVKSSTVEGERSFHLERLDYATLYYGRVKTDLSPEYGRTHSFTTRAETFSSVTVPANGTVETDPAIVKIVVAPIDGAKRYTIELNTQPDFSGASITKTSLTDRRATFAFKDLAHETTYYTRVKTEISSAFGATTQFTTRAPVATQRLWGLTTGGGANDQGTIFSFSVDSLTFTKHHDYWHEWGALLSGSLAATASGRFYGISMYPGTGEGEVFSIDKQGNFELTPTIGPHDGSVMLASDNYLYLLHDWINLFRGGIYRADPDGNIIPFPQQIIFRFTSTHQGLNPRATLIELPDGYLYGTAPYGAINGNGTLYRVRFDGTGFQVLHSFTGPDGANPDAMLTDGNDGYIYGMTTMGGNSDAGVLFRMSPDGNSFTKLFDFSAANGSNPRGSLLRLGDDLYGMTSTGGANGLGVIFRINTDGSGYTKLFDFDGPHGASPLGGLTVHSNGSLFGMTAGGGANASGVIFRIGQDGTGFTKLFDFSPSDGVAPNGNLLMMDDIGAPSMMMADASIEAPSQEKFASGISAHPNPFESSFTLEVRSNTPEDVRFVLTDMSGAVLHDARAQTNTPVQWGDQLERGIYILKVVRGEEVSVHRLIKK